MKPLPVGSQPLASPIDDGSLTSVGRGVSAEAPGLFRAIASDRPAQVIADQATWDAAGARVVELLRTAGVPTCEPHVFMEDPLPAEFSRVAKLESILRGCDAIPVAVGSGTINDLSKLAAHRVGRPYMVVATAASMDGYTAFGASITHEGSKQTFDCPAPQRVVADLEVLCAAPPELNAAGYADLLAKVTAGADWLLADALGLEPVDPAAWEQVQHPLRDALADPEGVRKGEETAIRRLMEGLLQSGFAMQLTRTSRPASGAEHQFSHLWDMEHHTHAGKAPLHGFKVGVATLAVTRLYEALLELPLEHLDLDRCCSSWPDWSSVEANLAELFPDPAVLRKAREETGAKWIDREALRAYLQRLREVWPDLRPQLRRQLLPSSEIARRLRAAGAPVAPEEIGISAERLRRSFRQAYHLRRRYTVLDLAVRAGVLDECL